MWKLGSPAVQAMMTDTNTDDMCLAPVLVGAVFVQAQDRFSVQRYRESVQTTFNETHAVLAEKSKTHFRGVDDLARFQKSAKFSAAREAEMVETLAETRAAYVQAKAQFLDARRVEEATRSLAKYWDLFNAGVQGAEFDGVARMFLNQVLLAAVWSQESPLVVRAAEVLEMYAQVCQAEEG